MIVTFSRPRHLIKAALAAALLAVAFALPSAAPANNVSSPYTSPTFGGGIPVTIPGDGHQVYRLHLAAGDWAIADAWKPGTHTADATIRVLDPTASDVASSAVATSAVNGMLFFQAPTAGNYFVDFTAAPGTKISRGLFLSRPTLTLKGAKTIAVPYGGGVTAACSFTDPLYNYVAFDGPEVAFETLVLQSSPNDVTYRAIWAGTTDVNGNVSHGVSGLTKKTVLFYGYASAMYGASAFGDAASAKLVVLPRVNFQQVPTIKPTHDMTITVPAAVQPTIPTGATNVVIQAQKSGGARLSFACTALAAKSGWTPLRASVSLPSGGTWSIRLYRPTDSTNAETATKWVRISVK